MATLQTHLADAYRDASLAGAPMKSVVEALEAIRTTAVDPSHPFHPAWDVLDREVAAASDPAMIGVLEGLRAGIVDSLTRQDGAEIVDVAAWRRAFGRSLERFRLIYCQVLAHAIDRLDFPLPGAAMLRAGCDALADYRWSEACLLLEEVATWEEIDVRARAYACTLRAEIEIYHLGDLAKARALLEEAARLSPDDARVVSCEGKLLTAERRFDEAKAKQEAAIKLDRGYSAPYIELGSALLAGSAPDPEGAEDWFEQATRCPGGSTAGYTQQLGLYQRPDWYASNETKIQDLYQRALRGDLHSRAEVHEKVADIYVANSELDRARAYYDLAIRDRRGGSDPATAKALLVARTGDVDTARQVCRTSFEDSKDMLVAWRLVEIEQLAKNWPAMRDWAQMVLDARPAWRGVVLPSLGRAQLELGELAAAEASLSEALRLAPEGDAQRSMEELTRHLGADFEAIERVLARIADARGSGYDSTRYNILGNRLYEHGEFARAADAYRKACDRKPQNETFWSNLAGACEAQWSRTPEDLRWYDDAFSALKRAHALAPQAGYLARGEALERRKPFVVRYGARTTAQIGRALVSPIEVAAGVELAEQLRGLDPNGALNAMVARLSASFGVVAPGLIEVAVDGTLPTRCHRVTLRRAVVASGTIPRAAPDALGPLVGAVERAILDGLPDLVGLEDAQRWLGGPPERDACALLRLMRLLLSERVSIADAPTILGVFSRDPHRAPHLMLADVRAQLAEIPGRRGPHVSLPTAAEELIRRATCVEPGLLGLEPVACQQFLAAVRSAAASAPAAALLVAEPSIRLFVRRVTEMEFPRLDVVSADEVTS